MGGFLRYGCRFAENCEYAVLPLDFSPWFGLAFLYYYYSIV